MGGQDSGFCTNALYVYINSSPYVSQSFCFSTKWFCSHLSLVQLYRLACQLICGSYAVVVKCFTSRMARSDANILLINCTPFSIKIYAAIPRKSTSSMRCWFLAYWQYSFELWVSVGHDSFVLVSIHSRRPRPENVDQRKFMQTACEKPRYFYFQLWRCGIPCSCATATNSFVHIVPLVLPKQFPSHKTVHLALAAVALHCKVVWMIQKSFLMSLCTIIWAATRLVATRSIRACM